MSIRVAIDQLGEEIAQRGAACFVVTVGTEGRPKIHHGTVVWQAEPPRLVAEVGRGTALNAAERPDVTLVWPVPESDPEQLHLLVDATAVTTDADGDPATVTVEPTSAIRHRVAADPHHTGERF